MTRPIGLRIARVKIWLNLRERTNEFLGAFASQERALGASEGKLKDNDSIITIPYVISELMPDGQITLEDILNAKEE